MRFKISENIEIVNSLKFLVKFVEWKSIRANGAKLKYGPKNYEGFNIED